MKGEKQAHRATLRKITSQSGVQPGTQTPRARVNERDYGRRATQDRRRGALEGFHPRQSRLWPAGCAPRCAAEHGALNRAPLAHGLGLSAPGMRCDAVLLRHAALLTACALLLSSPPSLASRETAQGYCGGEGDGRRCGPGGVDAAPPAEGEGIEASAGAWGGGEGGGGGKGLAGVVEPGLIWVSPLNWEIFHLRDRPPFAVRVALPPGVDVLLELSLDDHVFAAEWSNCTRMPCPGAGRSTWLRDAQFCPCRCSAPCDCGTCARDSAEVRYEVSVDEYARAAGDYFLAATAIFYDEPSGGRATLRVGSHFTLVDSWRDAFASTCARRRGGCPAWGGRVRAPAYPLPGNLYNRLSSQAAGSLAMQPGIIFVSPEHARVYAAGEAVRVALRFLDFVPSVDGMVAWGLVQVFEEGCSGPAGCRVSEPFLPRGAGGGGGGAQDCELEAAGCELATFRLAQGHYRVVASLRDMSGQELAGIRTAVFAVANASREELDRDGGSFSAPPCHPTHCDNPHAHKGGGEGGARAAHGGGGRRGSVLLVHEWAPLPGMNGDADRLRQLTFALAELGYATHVYAANCLAMHGDYLTMAPRSAGAHISCQLRDTELPALLQEGPTFDAAFIVSTEWYYPLRSLVQSFVPLIRETHPSTKIIVMADVLLAPDGIGLDDDDDGLYAGAESLAPDDEGPRGGGVGAREDLAVEGRAVPSDSGRSHAWNVGSVAEEGRSERPRASGAAAAQLMGLASADAVAVEVEEDAPWLRRLLPGLPVLPVRFTTVQPAVDEVAPFDRRAGMLWFGSAHGDNLKAIEWVALSVLPLVRAELGPESQDAILVVAGKDTDSSQVLRSAQGVKVLGHVQDIAPLFDSAKVCLSPTMLGSRRFQTKHLQAISRGLPVVATKRGVAGYGLDSQVTGSGQGMIVASAGLQMSEEEAVLLVQAVVDLVTDRGAWERESSAAVGLARTRFAFAEGKREVEALLEAVGVPRRGRA